MAQLSKGIENLEGAGPVCFGLTFSFELQYNWFVLCLMYVINWF